jgi:hypothetical protein
MWTQVDSNGQKNSTVVAHFFCALFFLAVLRFLGPKKVSQNKQANLTVPKTVGFGSSI